MSRWSIFPFFLLGSFLLEDHDEQMINLFLLPLVIFPPGGLWSGSFPSSSFDLSSWRIMMSRWLIFPFFLMWSFIMEDHDQDLSFLPLLIFPLWGSLWAGDQSLLSFSCDLSSWRIMMSRLSIFIFFLLWSFLLEDHNEQMINLSLLPLVIFPPGGSWWADDQSFPSSSCDLSS